MDTSENGGGAGAFVQFVVVWGCSFLAAIKICKYEISCTNIIFTYNM